MSKVIDQALECLAHEGRYHIDRVEWASEIVRLHSEVEDLRLRVSEQLRRMQKLTLDNLDLRDALQDASGVP